MHDCLGAGCGEEVVRQRAAEGLQDECDEHYDSDERVAVGADQLESPLVITFRDSSLKQRMMIDAGGFLRTLPPSWATSQPPSPAPAIASERLKSCQQPWIHATWRVRPPSRRSSMAPTGKRIAKAMPKHQPWARIMMWWCA